MIKTIVLSPDHDAFVAYCRDAGLNTRATTTVVEASTAKRINELEVDEDTQLHIVTVDGWQAGRAKNAGAIQAAVDALYSRVRTQPRESAVTT